MRKLLASILCAVLPAVGLSAAGGTAPFFRNFKAVTGRTPAQWLAEDSGSCPQ